MARKIFISGILVSCLVFVLYQALSSPEGLPKPNGNTGEVFAQMENDLSSEMEEKLVQRASKNEWIKAKVVKVRDGDTLELEKFRTISNPSNNTSQNTSLNTTSLISDLNQIGRVPTRFLAVDTPESTKIIQPYGKEASTFTKKLLEDKYVFIEIERKATYDKFGRLLCHVFTLSGESVQKILLERGYARVAYLFDDYKYVEDYKQAEELAKRNKIKIHSIPGYVTDKGFDMNVAETKIDVESIENTNYNDLFQAFELIEGLME